MKVMNVLIPFIVFILSAFIFAITKNPDVKELSKHGFWTGLLVTLFVFATTYVHL